MKRRFLSINFHCDTVVRFKGFCSKFGSSYTDTLEHMMDFFDRYQISPLENYGTDLWNIESNIKKRINALIAIIKDIEKHQTQPTTAMLQLLFEQTAPKENKPRLVAIDPKDKTFKEADFATSLEAIELRKEKNRLQRDLDNTKKQFEELLFSKIRIIKPSFGKPKLQLDISLKEYEALKAHIKKQ